MSKFFIYLLTIFKTSVCDSLSVAFSEISSLPLIYLILMYINLILCGALLFLEVRRIPIKENVPRFAILVSIFIFSFLDCLNAITPFPYSRNIGDLLCSFIPDYFFFLGWGVFILLIWNGTVVPFFSVKYRLPLQIIPGVIYALCYFCYILTSLISLGPDDPFKDISHALYIVMDSIFVIMSIIMEISLVIFLVRLRKQPRNSNILVAISSVKALTIMMTILLVIYVVNLAFAIYYLFILSNEEEVNGCLNADSTKDSSYWFGLSHFFLT